MLRTRQQPVWKGISLKRWPLMLLGASLTFVSGATTADAASLKLEVVANGLENPRRIAFGSDGALYVAEAGRGGPGPTILGPELNSSLSFGSTGAVTRVQNGEQERVVSGLPSLALVPEGTTAPRAKGSVLSAIGPHDIGFDRTGNPYGLIGYASTDSEKKSLGSAGDDLGSLVSFDVKEDRSWTKKSSVDLLAFRELYNPLDEGGFLNNPYDLEVQEDDFLVADAGGNNYFTVDSQENVSLGARFSPKNVDGSLVESVPTSITVGPDDAIYVGELTGNPYPEDTARVYRITSDGEPEVFASGFGRIGGLDFDDQGNLYVLEFAASSAGKPSVPTEQPGTGFAGALDDFAGALTRISPDGTRKTLIGPGEGLVAPNGVTVGPDDAFYISNFSTVIGKGEVVRAVPEPSSVLGVVAFGALGGASWLKRKRKQLAGKVKSCQRSS